MNFELELEFGMLVSFNGRRLYLINRGDDRDIFQTNQGVNGCQLVGIYVRSRYIIGDI